MAELRKSTSEMREVLRYMKREKDMLQAKLSVSESENTRLSGELQSLRRALDEVKVELKRELDKKVKTLLLSLL
jgi:regulator of replication initiation timing